MRSSIFSLLAALVLLPPAARAAESAEKADTAITIGETVPVDRQERWLLWAANYHRKQQDRYAKGWSKLIPSQVKLQYAGSIGFLSLGPGWDYGKKKQWETDLLLGIVPNFSRGKAAMSFTVKETYTPWSVKMTGRWSFEPLSTGLFVNSVFDEDFWVREPERYPKNYYKFSTRVRFHVFLAQRFTVTPNPYIPTRQLSFYYELSTCDLYIMTKATNRYVALHDILSLAFGIRLQFL